jgi:hypothetical protein
MALVAVGIVALAAVAVVVAYVLFGVLMVKLGWWRL